MNDRKTYREAIIECRGYGGLLALPKSETLNKYLIDQTQNHYGVVDELWIGLHDKKDESKFIWEDNEKLTWETFADDNGPDNNWFIKHFEDCVALNPIDGFWYDHPCDNELLSIALDSDPKKMYICQY